MKMFGLTKNYWKHKTEKANAQQPFCKIAGLGTRFEVLAVNKLQSSIES